MNFEENPGFWDDFWQDFKKVVKFSENPLYKINHQDLWYQKKTFLYNKFASSIFSKFVPVCFYAFSVSKRYPENGL